MSEDKKEPEVKCEPQPVNFEGLRNILFEELNLLRAGKISIARARTTSQLARRIIEASTLDLFAQMKLGSGTAEELKRLGNPNVMS